MSDLGWLVVVCVVTLWTLLGVVAILDGSLRGLVRRVQWWLVYGLNSFAEVTGRTGFSVWAVRLTERWDLWTEWEKPR